MLVFHRSAPLFGLYVLQPSEEQVKLVLLFIMHPGLAVEEVRVLIRLRLKNVYDMVVFDNHLQNDVLRHVPSRY